MAYVFNVLTEDAIPIWLGALISYGIVIVYVATSGVRGAAWSDVLQGILMLVVAWVVGFTVVYNFHDGVADMFRGIEASRPGFLTVGAYGSIVQFAPAVYGALWWRRGTSAGVLAGLVSGIAVNYYFQLVQPATPFDINAGILGLMVNVVLFIGVSMITNPAGRRAEEYVEA